MEHLELRLQIIEKARQMAKSGMVPGTWGNVSGRVPRQTRFLITPSGMEYDQMMPEDLVLMDGQGTVLEGRWKPSTEWRMHAAIYNARPDINAVIHNHSIYATAFAAARQPVPAVTEELAQVVGGPVPVACYEAAGTEELARAVVEALGDRCAVLLANHGVVAAGSGMEEAWRVSIIVEKTAQIAILARVLGNAHELSTEEIARLRNAFLHSYGQK